MEREHGVFWLPNIDNVEQLLAPQLARRHLEKMFDMYRGYDAFSSAVLTAVAAFHTRTTTSLDDELFDRLVGQNDAFVRFNEAP